MTALVVQTAFLGDVILTTPLLAAVAARHGPVDVVTTPAAAPLLETHPAVRRVIPYDKKGKDRGLGALLRLARRLRAERYEIAYLPHRSLRTAALAWAARIPRRVGFRGPWAALYTETRRRLPGPRIALGIHSATQDVGEPVTALHAPLGTHESARLLVLADHTGPPPRPSLHPTKADEAAVMAVLEEGGIEGDFVALAPGSIWGSKRWPYYGDLARWLSRRTSVVVVGGPEDVPLGEEIERAVGGDGQQVVNACGKLTLRQSAALIGLATLLVTNDSAPLHLASAMGTRVLAIFGPTIAEFGFGPVGEQDIVMGVRGLWCRPCHRHGPPACPLPHVMAHRCMRALGSDYVESAIEEAGALHRRD
ncbi:MAG TPA: glycosyltransferase family 9 protein [Gemmatimonadales bacterium]|nr:glycosyltransferase family 9 protein [Gemmatimonadales bacterium]